MKSKWITTGILICMALMFLGCSSFGTPKNETSDQAKLMNKDNLEANTEAVAKLKEMIKSGDAYTNDQIMPLYDQLDSVDLDFMVGTWKGGKFDAGKSPDPIHWYGKRFTDPNFVEPLLAQKPDGTVYTFKKWGAAQMREIKFRDKVSASLIYDQKPIIDYFRKIDDSTLLGVGETKGHITFFFYLTREKVVAAK